MDFFFSLTLGELIRFKSIIVNLKMNPSRIYEHPNEDVLSEVYLLRHRLEILGSNQKKKKKWSRKRILKGPSDYTYSVPI